MSDAFKPAKHAYRAEYGGARVRFGDRVRDAAGNRYLFAGLSGEDKVLVTPQRLDGTFDVQAKASATPAAVGLRIG